MYSFNLVYNLIFNIFVVVIENDFCIIQLIVKKKLKMENQGYKVSGK